MSDYNDESDENKSSSGIGYILLPILLIILVGVGYAFRPEVRSVIDLKMPWFREKVGHYLIRGDAAAAEAAAAAAAENPDPIPPFSLEVFATTPQKWPASVTLKTPVDFPAVVNGTVAGKVHAPAGSEVHLRDIKNGSLGVEFHGGGAWVKPENTDFMTRIHALEPPRAPAAAQQ